MPLFNPLINAIKLKNTSTYAIPNNVTDISITFVFILLKILSQNNIRTTAGINNVTINDKYSFGIICIKAIPIQEM